MINETNITKKMKLDNNNLNKTLPVIGKNLIIVNNIVDYYLKKDMPNRKAKSKISDEDFVIPNVNEYENIININYNLNQLKKICKMYSIKLNGNKVDLKKRLYNYLYFSNYSIIIQKFFRKIIIKNYIFLHGPAFFDRRKCVNDCDFCSLDNIKDIPYTQFISFKDEENFIYGFDIQSIYNLYTKNKTNVENPFTKKILGKNVFNTMMQFIKYSKLLRIKININYGELEILNETKKLEMKVLTLFQNMDSLGNYTNMNWFTSLNKFEIVKFMRELMDIWQYRANLTQETKREICPPFGNPFRILNINMNLAHNYSLNVVKKNAINLMDVFINKGINNDARSLGCYYILSSLTLVSNSAAEAMPWLYESVNHINYE